MYNFTGSLVRSLMVSSRLVTHPKEIIPGITFPATKYKES